MSDVIRFIDATLALFLLLPIGPLRTPLMYSGGFAVGFLRILWLFSFVICSGPPVSMIIGMGTLLRVRRLWFCRTLFNLVVVVSTDVPTLGVGVGSTLDGGLLASIVASCWHIFAWRTLSSALRGIVVFSAVNNALAAKTVLSSSEMVGALQ